MLLKYTILVEKQKGQVMTMKKGFTLFIAAALLALSIGGCNDGNKTSSIESNTNENDSSVTENSKNESEPNNKDESNTSSDIPDISTPNESETNSDTEESKPGIIIGSSTEIPEVSMLREQIATTAKSLIGIDYTFSEATPEKGFDNSGLIYYVLRENGYINCPRGTEDQLSMGTKISYDEVLPGDVVFFSDKDEETGEENYFGGIYVGDGMLVYSPYPGEKVKYGDFTNSYWKSKFSFGIKIA